jgi:uncharacterized protein (TIGR03437 family)
VRFSIALILCLSLHAASYIGDQFPYQVTALTTDAAGNTYVTGARAVAQNLTDVFVTKLDPSGNILQTFTLGGKYADQANGIAVDSAGNIWVAGVTTSPDFPIHNPLQATSASTGTGFLTKLAPDGSILFSTYLGGTTAMSAMNAVAVDAGGNAYVAGYTFAPDYPHTAGLPAGVPISSELGMSSTAFFAKISAAGDKILYAGGVSATMRACGAGSTCFLGPIPSTGGAIAVDPAGNAYVAGNAGGLGLPTTSGALLTNGIGAFVMKVNPAGSGLIYLTTLGTSNYVPGVAPSANPGNTVLAIAADAAGNAYITGATSDPNFPATKSVLQPVYSIPAAQINPFSKPPSDAFAAKLNPSGTAMVWATFLGGMSTDQGQAIAVDPSGNVWIAGTTSSSDFPVSSGSPNGGEFLVEFNATGSALSYGARFPVNTVATAIALDAKGTLHAAGGTGIISTVTAAPSTAPLLFGIANAAGGALAGRIAPGELISFYGENFGVATPAIGSFDSAGLMPTTLAGVQVAIGGVPVPLLYASNTQINAIAPAALNNSGDTQLQITVNGVAMPVFRVAIDPADPQVFANADGSAAAINQDGSINSAAHPAPAGSIVSIWATGTGNVFGADGQQTTTAQPTCTCYITHSTVTYAGTAPQLVNGVTQINFQVPSNVFTEESFNLMVGTAISDTRFVYTLP